MAKIKDKKTGQFIAENEPLSVAISAKITKTDWDEIQLSARSGKIWRSNSETLREIIAFWRQHHADHNASSPLVPHGTIRS